MIGRSPDSSHLGSGHCLFSANSSFLFSADFRDRKYELDSGAASVWLRFLVDRRTYSTASYRGKSQAVGSVPCTTACLTVPVPMSSCVLRCKCGGVQQHTACRICCMAALDGCPSSGTWLLPRLCGTCLACLAPASPACKHSIIKRQVRTAARTLAKRDTLNTLDTMDSWAEGPKGPERPRDTMTGRSFLLTAFLFWCTPTPAVMRVSKAGMRTELKALGARKWAKWAHPTEA